ncbi:MAG TPA: phosphatase [Candidatus Egerieimonas intestinavium]|uniref:Phosphatase n=1 Tax=Candidatus Egerieimonas intestinavium TaxID=2840777 RepID=A0A9D1ELN4_9FIRM|nr:phosphatase [Candidatus Egerieimonas intestinavium]
MNYVLDTHSHTVSSGHAYSTLKEMVQAAAGKGLEALALTEHAMAMPGACHEFHFSNYKVVPRQWEGLRLLCGVELNIMDFQGKVDMPERLLKKMDLVIASMHIPCLKRGSREENTAAALGVLENPYVDILGHPDDNRYPLDYRAVAQKAAETGAALEVNNSSLRPDSPRKGAAENYRELLAYCREYRVPVAVGSDAHIEFDVGRHDYAYQLLQQINFPEELVLNRSWEALRNHLNRRGLRNVTFD